MASTVYVANPDLNYPNSCEGGMIWDQVTGECIQDPAMATPGTPWWAWLLIAIAVAAVIGFLIWFIIWATSTDNPAADNDALRITGVEYKVLSSTSIGATWIGVGDPNDIVTLYVNPSGQDGMKFSREGIPLGQYTVGGPVPGSSLAVVASGLQIETTYDAVLVVTNDNLPDIAHAGSIESGLHTTSHAEHGAKFQVIAMNQGGSINYNLTPPNGIPPVVSYNRSTSNPNNSLFHHDNEGFICATTQGQSVVADTPCADGSSVLYSGAPNLGVAAVTGIATQSQLRIAQKSTLTTEQLANARWAYNGKGDNEWCLVNGNGCMTYDVESPDIVLIAPATGTTILATTPADGTTVVVATDSTFDTVNPAGNQAIFVSSTGSKWRNEKFA